MEKQFGGTDFCLVAPYHTKFVQDRLLSIRLTLTMTAYCLGWFGSRTGDRVGAVNGSKSPDKPPGSLELADVTEKKKCYIIAPELNPCLP